MGKLILIRHGESEGNAIRRFTTTPDAAITDLGRRQALEAAMRIKILFNPSRIIASPYFRARETARIIGEHLGLPIEIEQAFREQSLGDLAGKSYDIVREDASFSPERSWEWRPPGGESQAEVRLRTAPALDAVMRVHPDGEVLIVSHGGVMRALWAHMTDQWDGAYVPANCGIVVVDHDGVRYLTPRVLEAESDTDRETGG